MAARPAGRRVAHLVAGLLAAIALTTTAQAMRIVLTNDDGFENRNLQALYTALKAAGHDVILSAPFRDQSGSSAQPGRTTGIPPTPTPSPGGTLPAGSPGIGPTTLGADQYYVDSTPVAAVAHGIDVLAPAKWNAPPELVISGPNAGNNLGYVTPYSGTVGAAITAINRGVPAIAISGADADPATTTLLAEIALRVVVAATEQGRISLPAGTGLNVNVPALDRARAAASYRYVFTQLHSIASGTDANPFSEDNAFGDGNTVTVTPIQGTYQAPPERAAQVLTKLRGLFATAAPVANPKLINVSVRGPAGPGAAAQIIGFVISGPAPKTTLIRAGGPALIPFGVTDALPDPTLELFDRDNRSIAVNDNWSADAAGAAAIATAAVRVGAYAWTTGSRDAALLVTLAPGPHTVVVKGVGSTTGTVLIEVYDASVD